MRIAIDGPAGAGKSTIAKRLAARLGLVYMDTGAMYRAVALKALQTGTGLQDAPALEALLANTRIELKREGGEQHIWLDGQDVSGAIRTQEVSDAASLVSTVGVVRVRLVAMQQALAQGLDIVMDGRDIGTKVLPNADYKFFLTASVEERAKRRQKEMAAKGETMSLREVKRLIEARDLQDSTRAESPLTCAPGAIVVDTSALDISDVLVTLLALMGRV